MISPDLPLVDLHRHLDGTVRLGTLLDLAEKHGIELPAQTPEALRPHVQVLDREGDLLAFLARFRWLTAVMADLDACRRIAYENVERASEEQLDYVELRFSPWFMAETHSLQVAGVVEVVIDGVAAGVRDFGVPVGLIGILSRTYGPETCRLELEALLGQRDHLVAIDLAGDEAGFPAELFGQHFARAREQGLQVTVHAGEACGPESIWSALRELGAARIGHCVRAQDDPKLLDYLGEHRIGIEANLTSNVQTSAVAGYAEHPMADFLRRGLLATLNTDDPTISGIDLAYEYDIAAPRAGLDLELVRLAQDHAVEIAFLDESSKADLRRKAAARGVA